MEEYYKTLGVEPYMTMKEIKKKYMKLMRKTHPDRCGQDDLCKKITQAYQMIINYKLNNNPNENNIIPLEFKNIDLTNDNIDLDYVRQKINSDSNENNIILELEDKKYKKKSMFAKVFDFFFDYDTSDDDSSDED